MRRQLRLFLAALLAPLLAAGAPAHALQVPALVSSDWLQQQLGQPGLRIIEVSDQTSYEFDGHIPGAIHTSKGDWRYQADDGTPVHHPAETLQQRWRALGLNPGDGVVIYYKGNGLNDVLGAHYLFWLLHYLGHTNVAMLDKGWQGWLQLDGEVSEDSPDIEAGTFEARPLRALEIGTDELASIREHYLLLDGRPASHYAGTDKFPANPKHGRIPGSISLPWEAFMHEADDGRQYIAQRPLSELLPPDTLTAMQSANRPLLITCFGGTGSAVVYALLYQQGFQNLRLDDAGLRRWNARELELTR